jgi:hypothetical protein
MFDRNMWLSMTGELQRYLDDVLWSADGTLDKLYTTTQTYADKRLAAIYGIQPPAADGSFARASVDPRQRAGFLTQPAWIASHTGGMEMTPVPPGAAVRKGLLCQVLPDPPPNVPKPSQDKSTSVRERFRAHSADPACSGCHTLIDPIGNGFETFDVMGRYRDKDAGGFALTGAGALTSTDADGAFSGAPELARKLGASTVARECFAAELLEYLTGRSLARDDRRLQVDRMSVAQVIAKAGGNVKAAALGLVQSPAFLLRDPSHIAPGGNP